MSWNDEHDIWYDEDEAEDTDLLELLADTTSKFRVVSEDPTYVPGRVSAIIAQFAPPNQCGVSHRPNNQKVIVAGAIAAIVVTGIIAVLTRGSDDSHQVARERVLSRQLLVLHSQSRKTKVADNESLAQIPSTLEARLQSSQQDNLPTESSPYATSIEPPALLESVAFKTSESVSIKDNLVSPPGNSQVTSQVAIAHSRPTNIVANPLVSQQQQEPMHSSAHKTYTSSKHLHRGFSADQRNNAPVDWRIHDAQVNDIVLYNDQDLPVLEIDSALLSNVSNQIVSSLAMHNHSAVITPESWLDTHWTSLWNEPGEARVGFAIRK